MIGMEKVVYLDYSALAIFAVLLGALIFKGIAKSRFNYLFIALVGVMLASAAFDIFAVWGDNLRDTNYTWRYVAHIGYLVFHNITPLLYLVYLVSQSDTWHRLWSIKSFRNVAFTPCLAVVLLILTSPFSKAIFYFNENAEYVRGPLFILLYIQSGIYLVLGITYAFYYKKAFEKGRFVSLMILYPFLLAAVLLQMFFPKALLEMFACALSILFVSIMVQRPEDRIDRDSGFQSASAFKSDMIRSQTVKKSMALIAIAITNYDMIRNLVGYEQKKVIQNNLGTEMLALGKGLVKRPDMYYLGGGKFVVALYKNDIMKTSEYARKINDYLVNPLSFNSVDLNMVANVCTISVPHTMSDAVDLITFIENLSNVNYTGSVMYASDMVKKGNMEISKNITRIIERALSEGHLQVYYQPIYSIATGKFKSAEALIRLIDPDYGFIPPDIFIPAAEGNGLIYRIGKFVLAEVCSFIGSDEFKGLGVDYIEVNLSALECMQENLPEIILGTLEKYGVSTSQVNLEVTETAAVYSQTTLIKNLEKLVEAGINFSLDDFGTGYSNMTRIATLPLTIIKMDKSFVNAPRTDRMVNMIENTVKMIKSMKYEIVVEGIETDDMRKWFSEMGCDFIQGYYFSKPLPKADYVEFLKRNIEG